MSCRTCFAAAAFKGEGIAVEHHGLGLRFQGALFQAGRRDEQQFTGRLHRLVEDGNEFFLGERGRALRVLRQIVHELGDTQRRGLHDGADQQRQPDIPGATQLHGRVV